MILFFLSIPRCIKRKKLIKSLEEVEDEAFVEEFLKSFHAPQEYVIAKRRKLARQLHVPYKKLAPNYKFGTIGDCWILTADGDKSMFLIECLTDYLSKYIDSPFYGEEISIETVSEYIYYSAIRDGALFVFR